MVRTLVKSKQVGLWWRKQDEPNDERNDQPFETVTDKMTGRSGFERKPGARSGQEEEQ